MACDDGSDSEESGSSYEDGTTYSTKDAGALETGPSGGGGSRSDAGSAPLGSDAGSSGTGGSTDASTSLPPLAVKLATPTTFGSYSFSVPPAAAGQVSNGIYKIVYPAGAAKPECVIVLAPPIAAQSNLEAQASTLMLSALDGAGRLGQPLYGAVDARGRSSKGWSYVVFDREAFSATGQRTGVSTRAMMVQLGSMVAPVLAAVFGAENCLDSGPLLWSYLIYSLKFPAHESADDGSLARSLVGAWAPTVSDNGRGRGRICVGTCSRGCAETRPTYSHDS